jgi:AcrR family transcriptional regulator
MVHMGIEKTRDAEATRQRILAAAEIVFAEQGYDGARVDTIAERAAINKRMLYHYFGDKAQLYAAVIEAIGLRLLQRMQATFRSAEHEDPIVALRLLLGTFFDVTMADPRYARLLIQEAATDWRGLRAVEAAQGGAIPGGGSIEALLGYTFPLLERGIASGQFRPDLDKLLVTTLFSAVCRIYVLLLPRLNAFYDEPLDSAERLAWARSQIVDLFLNGVTR